MTKVQYKYPTVQEQQQESEQKIMHLKLIKIKIKLNKKRTVYTSTRQKQQLTAVFEVPEILKIDSLKSCFLH